ncbi:MAG: sn-glycerol-3-phosphate ABC transporter ATP-binding protein UgpC [Planctomycetota bacterium]
MADVVLRQVTKEYRGGVVAVKDASLEVADGEFLVLVGPSGCGKSSLLRMIAGLEDVTRGEIVIGGRRVNEVPPRDRDIAMVFQNYALYPHMSVRDNLAFGLKVRGTARDEIDRRVREAAETLGLGDLLQRRPKELSGGQKQRVAVGRAIVRQPVVFLFDEPLSNLDAKLRVEMRAELKRLHQRLKTTMIYVTHDQTEALTLGDRIVLMRDGIIQQVAAPLEMYRFPSNAFVASFIGTPSINLVEGRLERRGDEACFVCEPFVVPLPGSLRSIAEERLGGPVVLGVRAESLREATGNEPDTVPVTVDHCEPLGDHVLVHARCGPAILIARIGPEQEWAAGGEHRLAVDRERVLLFDPESEQRLGFM